MEKSNKQVNSLTEDKLHLTFDVAKDYLEKKYWSSHEAVMLIAGYNPACNPFYDDDNADERSLARLIWGGIRQFNPNDKQLPVETWVDWATIGTIDYPRIAPIGFGPEFKKAISKNNLKPLEKALSESDQETPLPIKKIKVKGAWRFKVQEAAYFIWCKLNGSGSNPSVLSISHEMARWCVENNVKNDYNGHPSVGSIRNTVLDSKNWDPPNMSRENAKQFVLNATQTLQVAQVAQAAQVPKEK